MRKNRKFGKENSEEIQGLLEVGGGDFDEENLSLSLSKSEVSENPLEENKVVISEIQNSENSEDAIPPLLAIPEEFGGNQHLETERPRRQKTGGKAAIRRKTRRNKNIEPIVLNPRGIECHREFRWAVEKSYRERCEKDERNGKISEPLTLGEVLKEAVHLEESLEQIEKRFPDSVPVSEIILRNEENVQIIMNRMRELDPSQRPQHPRWNKTFFNEFSVEYQAVQSLVIARRVKAFQRKFQILESRALFLEDIPENLQCLLETDDEDPPEEDELTESERRLVLDHVEEKYMESLLKINKLRGRRVKAYIGKNGKAPFQESWFLESPESQKSISEVSLTFEEEQFIEKECRKERKRQLREIEDLTWTSSDESEVVGPLGCFFQKMEGEEEYYYSDGELEAGIDILDTPAHLSFSGISISHRPISIIGERRRKTPEDHPLFFTGEFPGDDRFFEFSEVETDVPSSTSSSLSSSSSIENLAEKQRMEIFLNHLEDCTPQNPEAELDPDLLKRFENLPEEEMMEELKKELLAWEEVNNPNPTGFPDAVLIPSLPNFAGPRAASDHFEGLQRIKERMTEQKKILKTRKINVNGKDRIQKRRKKKIRRSEHSSDSSCAEDSHKYRRSGKVGGVEDSNLLSLTIDSSEIESCREDDSLLRNERRSEGRDDDVQSSLNNFIKKSSIFPKYGLVIAVVCIISAGVFYFPSSQPAKREAGTLENGEKGNSRTSIILGICFILFPTTFTALQLFFIIRWTWTYLSLQKEVNSISSTKKSPHESKKKCNPNKTAITRGKACSAKPPVPQPVPPPQPIPDDSYLAEKLSASKKWIPLEWKGVTEGKLVTKGKRLIDFPPPEYPEKLAVQEESVFIWCPMKFTAPDFTYGSGDLRSINLNSLSTQSDVSCLDSETRSDRTVPFSSDEEREDPNDPRHHAHYPDEAGELDFEKQWDQYKDEFGLFNQIQNKGFRTNADYETFLMEDFNRKEELEYQMDAPKRKAQREEDIKMYEKFEKQLQENQKAINILKEFKKKECDEMMKKQDKEQEAYEAQKMKRKPLEHVARYIEDSYIDDPDEEIEICQIAWKQVDNIDNYITSSYHDKWDHLYRCYSPRYTHDWCRVRMSRDDEEECDFYDACHVYPYHDMFYKIADKIKNKFICSACPMHAMTVGILWHWLFENDVKYMVMLNGFVERFLQTSVVFFPKKVGEKMRVRRNTRREYIIECLSVSKKYKNCGIQRQFKITLILDRRQFEVKTLKMLHMLDWVQDGLPPDWRHYVPIAERLIKESLKSSVVVMSKHGSGRAMTLILSCLAALIARYDDDVSIHALVHGGRASKRQAIVCCNQVYIWRMIHYELLFRMFPATQVFRTNPEARFRAYQDCYLADLKVSVPLEARLWKIYYDYEVDRFKRMQFLVDYLRKRTIGRKYQRRMDGKREKLMWARNASKMYDENSPYKDGEPIRRKPLREGETRKPNRPKRKYVERVDMTPKENMYTKNEVNPWIAAYKINGAYQWVKKSKVEETLKDGIEMPENWKFWMTKEQQRDLVSKGDC